MATDIVRNFIKGSDNVVQVTLTEDDAAITTTWTQLKIYVGAVTITRTANGDGVSLTSGVLQITPAELSESLATLTNDKHRVLIRLRDSGNPNGVYFAADDSDEHLYFNVTDPLD